MSTIRRTPPPSSPPPRDPREDPGTQAARSSPPATSGATARRAAEEQARGALAEPGAQAPARRLSAQDAERLASQSAFARNAGRRRRLGLDAEDSAQAPIPLPVDEVDESAWEQGTLDDAQGQLTVHGHQVAEAAAAVEGGGDLGQMARALVAGGFSPTSADTGRLEAIAARTPEGADAPAPDAAQASMSALFGLSLAGVEVGAQRVAAALVVAGRADAVEPTGDGQLAADKLAGGVQAVLEGGSRSVADARAMHEGVSRKLAHQRTFVFKR